MVAITGNSCAVEVSGDNAAATERGTREFGSDAELEIAIAEASDKLGDAQGRPAKLAAWRELVRLIDQRSPLQVFAMEREKGLLR